MNLVCYCRPKTPNISTLYSVTDRKLNRKGDVMCPLSLTDDFPTFLLFRSCVYSVTDPLNLMQESGGFYLKHAGGKWPLSRVLHSHIR